MKCVYVEKEIVKWSRIFSLLRVMVVPFKYLVSRKNWKNRNSYCFFGPPRYRGINREQQQNCALIKTTNNSLLPFFLSIILNRRKHNFLWSNYKLVWLGDTRGYTVRMHNRYFLGGGMFFKYPILPPTIIYEIVGHWKKWDYTL